MPYLTSKHVFYFLMFLSGVVFFVPTRFVSGKLPQATVLYAPVSWPAMKISQVTHDVLAGADRSADTRDADIVRRENEELKNKNSALEERVAYLEKEATEWKQVGDVSQWGRHFAVAST